MDRGKLSFTFILVLTFGAFLVFHPPFAESRELRVEVSCYSDVLHLDCGKSVVAVHSASFTTSTSDQNHTSCRSPARPENDYIEDEDDEHEPNANESVCHEDVRVAVNRVCSGFKSCNYSYSQQQEKRCYSPEGVVVVQFDCVRESNINKYCNSKVHAREGYISSPGFPQYYPELKSCSWQITALEGQSIRLSVLHLHLRDASDIIPTMTSDMEYHVMGQLMEQVLKRCDDDRLIVLEGTHKVWESCGESADALRTVEVDGVAGLELRFRSAGFLPASGFLVYFKVLGCPTLAAGEDSHLVERNGSAAVYACRANHVFNDSLDSHRFLKCVRDHHWNDTLPPCITIEDTTSTITMVTSISIEEDFMNLTGSDNVIHPLLDKRVSLIGDIIIPAVIIGVLLIVNGIVLIVIFIIRRRQKPVEEEFEELKPCPIEITEEPPTTSPKESEPQPTVSKPPTSPKRTESPPTILIKSPQSSRALQPSDLKHDSSQSSLKDIEAKVTIEELPQDSPKEKGSPTFSNEAEV